jgi:hypothetical protein
LDNGIKAAGVATLFECGPNVEEETEPNEEVILDEEIPTKVHPEDKAAIGSESCGVRADSGVDFCCGNPGVARYRFRRQQNVDQR